jgi:YggT family protein
MDIILIPTYSVIDFLLWAFFWVLIFSVIMSWLLAFGVVNTSNQLVSTISDFLFRVTEPVLRPIRRILPDFGGLDLSPLVMLLAIHFIRDVLQRLMFTLMGVPH